MKISITKILGIAPRMVDPIRLPKVIVPLEKEFKDSYKIEMQKMLVDITKKMVEMKTLLFIVLMLLCTLTFSQTITYLKVADKADYQKYYDYCMEGVSKTFTMRGEVTLVKVNGYYTQPVTGAWTAKYPLVVKWYPIDVKSTTTEAYQHEIIAIFEAKVPRRYPPSIDDYYKHWKNGDIQAGYIDSKSCAVWP